jgi:hypothetical protein
MAFKEVRVYFRDPDKETTKEIQLEIGGPFTWAMDSVMRGKFKLYSGDEVKGINIVNLHFHTPNSANRIRSKRKDWKCLSWSVGLNTYDCDVEKEFSYFKGSRTNKVKMAIDLFLECAQFSPFPQMATLIAETKSSVNDVLIENAVNKADLEWKRIVENAWKYEKIIEEAKRYT